jgi:hypothetical protein
MLTYLIYNYVKKIYILKISTIHFILWIWCRWNFCWFLDSSPYQKKRCKKYFFFQDIILNYCIKKLKFTKLKTKCTCIEHHAIENKTTKKKKKCFSHSKNWDSCMLNYYRHEGKEMFISFLILLHDILYSYIIYWLMDRFQIYSSKSFNNFIFSSYIL